MTLALEERFVVALERLADVLTAAKTKPARTRKCEPAGGCRPREMDDGENDTARSGIGRALCVGAPGFAQLLDVSERSLHRLDDAGKVPAGINLGGCKRWSRREIEAWIAAGCPARKEWNLRSVVAAPRDVEGGLPRRR